MLKRPFAKKTNNMGAGAGGVLAYARSLKKYGQEALVSAKKSEEAKRALKSFSLAYEAIEKKGEKASNSDFNKLKKSAIDVAAKLKALKPLMEKTMDAISEVNYEKSFPMMEEGLKVVEEDAKNNKLTDIKLLYSKFLGT